MILVLSEQKFGSISIDFNKAPMISGDNAGPTGIPRPRTLRHRPLCLFPSSRPRSDLDRSQARPSKAKRRQANTSFGSPLGADQPQAASLWSFVRRNKAMRLARKQAKTGIHSRRPCTASPPCLDAYQPPKTSRARSNCQLCHVSTSATVPPHHHHQSRSRESALA